MTDDLIFTTSFAPGRPTRVSYSAAWYIEQAEIAIRKLLQAEHALVWHEIEAKISDGPPGRYSPRNIDPHHLTTAKRRMLDSGEIHMSSGFTRGGREITVYSFTNDFKIKEAIKIASGRKRLLETRYLGWARGSRDSKLIGDAGELALHNALKAAAVSRGYFIEQGVRRFGNVDRLFGELVPAGSLDNVAHLIIDINTSPPTVATVLCEVKNLRSWLYPSSEEVYQLLEKAARLQIAHPDRNFVPVLICRRAQFLLRIMAKHLGFRVGRFTNGEQPIMRSALYTPEELAEVRDELGYLLTPIEGDYARPDLVGFFEKVIPSSAAEASARWKLIAPALVDQFALLRGDQLHGQARETLLNEVARVAHAVVPENLNWRNFEDETTDNELAAW